MIKVTDYGVRIEAEDAIVVITEFGLLAYALVDEGGWSFDELRRAIDASEAMYKSRKKGVTS